MLRNRSYGCLPQIYRRVQRDRYVDRLSRRGAAPGPTNPRTGDANHNSGVPRTSSALSKAPNGVSVLTYVSAASADALSRGFCPIFLFDLFCLKLFKFWRAALRPWPQMLGSITWSGGSTDSSDRLRLSMCVRRTRDLCLQRSYLRRFCRCLERS